MNKKLRNLQTLRYLDEIHFQIQINTHFIYISFGGIALDVTDLTEELKRANHIDIIMYK